MNQRHATFKETQLFDWDTEPQLERSSSFFFTDEVTAAQVRRAERERLQKARRRNVTIVAGVGVILVGVVALMQLGPLLKHLFA